VWNRRRPRVSPRRRLPDARNRSPHHSSARADPPQWSKRHIPVDDSSQNRSVGQAPSPRRQPSCCSWSHRCAIVNGQVVVPTTMLWCRSRSSMLTAALCSDRNGPQSSRAMSSGLERKYVNVRRLLVFLEASIDKSRQWAVFAPKEPAAARRWPRGDCRETGARPVRHRLVGCREQVHRGTEKDPRRDFPGPVCCWRRPCR
jgi:hypothetical protein